MRNIAGVALTTSAIFLAIVAVMLGSSALFYMSTAMIATIGACRLQAWLSVRGLRFEREAPDTVNVGDLVTIQISVWSDRRIRRPLVTIDDNLPPRLLTVGRSPSLPIAPAYDVPIRTQYQFRPSRRGIYRWSGLTVSGTDALGLVTMSKQYTTLAAEMTVLPVPIPVSVELGHVASWGANEMESGRSRGQGIEPRGVREYVAGDPLKHIHWRSSAKSSQLLVKEFEAGANAPAAFIIQRTNRTDIGRGAMTSLELMCGHITYISDNFLRQGIPVEFPTLEESSSPTASHPERYQEILHTLAGVVADRPEALSAEIEGLAGNLETGTVVYLFLTVADGDLPAMVSQIVRSGHQVVVLLYNPEHFVAGKRPVGIPSSTDAAYIGRLADAGAQTFVMPLDGRLKGTDEAKLASVGVTQESTAGVGV
jgi:uncharacterized protein (DUF58 family)